jgi:hypothetical protein
VIQDAHGQKGHYPSLGQFQVMGEEAAVFRLQQVQK